MNRDGNISFWNPLLDNVRICESYETEVSNHTRLQERPISNIWSPGHHGHHLAGALSDKQVRLLYVYFFSLLHIKCNISNRYLQVRAPIRSRQQVTADLQPCLSKACLIVLRVTFLFTLGDATLWRLWPCDRECHIVLGHRCDLLRFSLSLSFHPFLWPPPPS